MSDTIDWVEFSHRRRGQREAAVRAVTALRSGDPTLALALLKPWFPAGFEPAQQLALSELLATKTHTTLGSLYPELAQPQPPMSAFEHHCALADQAPGSPQTDPLVWMLAELLAIGERIVELERQGWGQPDSAADAEVLSCWTALCYGSPFTDAAVWTARFESPFMGVLAGACKDAKLSDGRRAGVLADARDNLYFVLAKHPGRIDGWREVALRAMELHPSGPLFALLDALERSRGREAWRRVGRCLAVRGEWRKTLHKLWPVSRAEACAEALAGSPEVLEDLVGVHLIRRLLARWGEGALHPRSAWCTARANRSILRARLRAMLCELPADSLFELALTAPGLASRTDRALRRFALAWAWHQARRGFPGDTENTVTVPCVEAPPAEDLDFDFSMLRRWVLLVVLRGRLAHLERWVDTGSTGDKDATWGRLLTDELPDALRERTPGSPHAALKVALSLALSEHLIELIPTLLQLAALPNDSGLPAAFNEVIAPFWHDDLPELKRGFARMQDHARAALAAMPLAEEDRWTR